MKRFLFYAIVVLVLCAMTFVSHALYLWFVLPARIIDIVERNHGYVDESEPPREIRIERLTDTDQKLLMEYLPHVSGLLEVSIAHDPPSALWFTTNIDLSDIRRVSVSISKKGSTSSDIIKLISVAPRMEQIAVYQGQGSAADIASIRQMCVERHVSVLFIP